MATTLSRQEIECTNLLHLELDGCFDLIDLFGEFVLMRHHGGELASLVETGAQQTRDLLDQRL
jgi:hypothetical protein